MGGGWEEVDERWMGGDGRRWMQADGRWMRGGGWEVDGRGREMDAASAASVWYIMSKPVRTPLYEWRWMGGGYSEWGECIIMRTL